MPGRFEFQPNFDIGPGACAVFMTRLVEISDIRVDDSVLSIEERNRCARFVQLADQNRFIAGRTMLRTVLSTMLGIDVNAIEFEFVNGKPFLHKKHQSALGFNISHSGSRVGLAVVGEGNVGVDIEQHDSRIDLDQIARRVMSQNELNEFDLTDTCDKTRQFFRLWAQKEAVLKCIGSGFSIEPARLDLGLSAENPRSVEFNHQHFRLHSNLINDGPEYSVAVAVDQGVTDVRFCEFDYLSLGSEI